MYRQRSEREEGSRVRRVLYMVGILIRRKGVGGWVWYTRDATER